jgi:hypothetical protein
MCNSEVIVAKLYVDGYAGYIYIYSKSKPQRYE